MSQPKKHHYIPVFYLKRWIIGPDGKICEFSRPYKEVRPKRIHPDGTGYVERLYELSDLPPESAQEIESLIMRPVDTMASDALAAMERGIRNHEWTADLRSAWTRFMLSLLLRTPQDVSRLKEDYATEWMRVTPEEEVEYALKRAPSWPATWAEAKTLRTPSELESHALRLTARLIDHKDIGQLINDMVWLVIETGDADLPLMTSDRPIGESGRITGEGVHFIMPLGPQRLFAAVNGAEPVKSLLRKPKRELVKTINKIVISGAVRYVYGSDDRNLPFVQKHFGMQPQPSLLERLAQFRARHRSHR